MEAADRTKLLNGKTALSAPRKRGVAVRDRLSRALALSLALLAKASADAIGLLCFVCSALVSAHPSHLFRIWSALSESVLPLALYLEYDKSARSSVSSPRDCRMFAHILHPTSRTPCRTGPMFLLWYNHPGADANDGSLSVSLRQDKNHEA